MKLEVVAMKPWQSKVLNKVAYLIGIKGEDVWCMTLTKDAVEQFREDRARIVAEEVRAQEKDPYHGTAYCIRCKENREFTGWIRISDSGRQMAQGNCPICGTKVNRILGLGKKQ